MIKIFLLGQTQTKISQDWHFRIITDLVFIANEADEQLNLKQWGEKWPEKRVCWVTATRNKHSFNSEAVLQSFFKANNIHINSLFSQVSEVEHCFHTHKKNIQRVHTQIVSFLTNGECNPLRYTSMCFSQYIYENVLVEFFVENRNHKIDFFRPVCNEITNTIIHYPFRQLYKL